MHQYAAHTSLRGVGGLLLAGGGDVQPALYGAQPAATLDHLDPARDTVERRAYLWARARGLRVLGICRGAQLMAAVSGGSLIQDLAAAGYRSHMDMRHDRIYAGLLHGVKAEPTTLAETILDGVDEINSHHHQAIAAPGSGLTPSAWSEDGVIEAIEGPHQLGVQWHPENLFAADHRHLRPFRWLVHGEKGLKR